MNKYIPDHDGRTTVYTSEGRSDSHYDLHLDLPRSAIQHSGFEIGDEVLWSLDGDGYFVADLDEGRKMHIYSGKGDKPYGSCPKPLVEESEFEKGDRIKWYVESDFVIKGKPAQS